MSKIVLQTVLTYRGDAEHRPLDKELSLTGIEKLFVGVEFPVGGPTFLYGNRNPGIPFLRELAEKLGRQAAVVDLHVEIGKWFRHKLDLSEDPDKGIRFANFLSVARSNRDVLAIMQEEWLRVLGPDRNLDDGWPKQATSHPYLIDNVKALPEFKHLDVIAYTVRTTIGEVQVATVFDLDKIVLVDGGQRLKDTEIYIP
jgi:hypothetical protein